jgi:hypothetical protein
MIQKNLISKNVNTVEYIEKVVNGDEIWKIIMRE